MGIDYNVKLRKIKKEWWAAHDSEQRIVPHLILFHNKVGMY